MRSTPILGDTGWAEGAENKELSGLVKLPAENETRKFSHQTPKIEAITPLPNAYGVGAGTKSRVNRGKT